MRCFTHRQARRVARTAVLLLVCIAANAQAPQTVLTQAWHTVDAFESPESVIFDQARGFIYVSNGRGYAKNNSGFISKLSQTGVLIDLRWLKDLNRPTGMAIRGNRLYVADIDTLVEIDLDEERITRRYPVTDPNPMLNDVAITSTGDVYVTASGNHAVYHLRNGNLVLAYRDKVTLESANGIVARGDRLVVAGMNIASIDPSSGAMAQITTRPQVADFDGLAADGMGRLLCTQVSGQGRLWAIDSEGAAELMFSHDGYLADFDLATIAGEDYLLIATGDHQTKQYGVLALRYASAVLGATGRGRRETGVGSL